MAVRDGTISYDQLHRFVASGVWDAEPLEAALLARADVQVGRDDALLIVDDTALPKKGRSSVGVARNMPARLARTPTARRWYR